MDNLGLFERPILAAHCVHVNNNDIKIMAQNMSVSHIIRGVI